MSLILSALAVAAPVYATATPKAASAPLTGLAAEAAAAAKFGLPLSCVGGLETSVIKTAEKSGAFEINGSDGFWAFQALARIGYPAMLPTDAKQRHAADVAGALIRRGYIVAAKMANDEASARVAGYEKAPFASSFESMLTVMTQPIQHASYPSTILAEGETAAAKQPGAHTHGVDLEKATASLNEIIFRAAVTQRGLGDLYKRPAVRFYMLANGFRDPIALKAATAGVCGMKLKKDQVGKLDVAARFMAMPSAQESK